MFYPLKNSVRLIGNLGKDPEIRTFESGKRQAKLSVATNESYKKADGEKVDDTQWHTVVAWGHTVEIIEKFLRKGSEVAIGGRLVHRNYTQKDGTKRFITEVQANEVHLFGKRTNPGL